jgi:MFS family permease
VVAGAALIGLGIAIISAVLLPDVPIVVAAAGWAVAGLGMGLAYSMLTLLVLETSTPGEEGFSSAALTLMFTLGTALGAGAGGAVVALADRGIIALAGAVGIVNLVMLVVAIGAVVTSVRVPARGPAAGPRRAPSGAGMPIEHP